MIQRMRKVAAEVCPPLYLFPTYQNKLSNRGVDASQSRISDHIELPEDKDGDKSNKRNQDTARKRQNGLSTIPFR